MATSLEQQRIDAINNYKKIRLTATGDEKKDEVVTKQLLKFFSEHAVIVDHDGTKYAGADELPKFYKVSLPRGAPSSTGDAKLCKDSSVMFEFYVKKWGIPIPCKAVFKFVNNSVLVEHLTVGQNLL